MKKLILILLLFIAAKSEASHQLASTFTIQHDTGLTYTIKGYIYRDCGGITASPFMDIAFRDTNISFMQMGNVQLYQTGTSIMPVFTCAPNTPFLCINGFGIEILTYQGQVTLPHASDAWHFSYSECCRSAQINIFATAPGGSGMFCEAYLDNLNFPNNSLPEFNFQNVPVFCLNQPAIFPNTAIEPDGDSIVYELIGARENQQGNGYMTGIDIPYLPPYSLTNYVTSSVPQTFDPATGIASFTPTMIQSGVMVVRATEYRNGIRTGSTMRDINVMVVDGINDPSLVEGTVFLDTNANNVLDPGEQGIPNMFIEASPNYSFSLTDANGHYSMYIGTGAHTTEIVNLPSWFTITPAQHNFNFTSAGNLSTGNDFAVTAVPGITDLQVTLMASAVRPGVSTPGHITITNLGSDPASGTLSFNSGPLVTLTSATPSPDSTVGTVSYWSIGPLDPLSMSSIVINLTADSTLVMGDSVWLEAFVQTTSATDADLNNNSSGGYAMVVNSYDPNIKSVFTNGPVTVAQVQAGVDITYRIDFQNTGTAPAIDVRITDFLPYEVDLHSLDVLAYSHAGSLTLKYPRELEFNFKNINLPDSGTDMEASQGFVIFKVTLENYLQAGQVFSNYASIYFDNNAPVITPPAITEIAGNSTGLAEAIKTNEVLVYPNPAADEAYVVLPSSYKGHVIADIYDLSGKLIMNRKLKTESNSFRINTSDLSSGMYVIKIQAGQLNYTARLLCK